MHAENSTFLVQWFNQTSNVVEKSPHQTAYFIQRMLKKVSTYKNAGLLLGLVDSIEENIRFYLPNYNEFKSFVQFLDEFQRGELDEM